MLLTEKVKMLMTGIVLLIIPVVILYLNFVEDMWGGTEYDWLGTLASLVFLGLGLYAIREGLKSPPKNASTRIPPPSLPQVTAFCVNFGTPRQPTNKFFWNLWKKTLGKQACQ